MNYTDKLNKIKGNLPNLENKSKEDLLKFIELIINMSLSREEANQHIDELVGIVHEDTVDKWQKIAVDVASKIFDKCEQEKKEEVESWRRLSAQITEEVTEEIKKLEKAAGYQLGDLTDKLESGKLKIVEGE